MKKRFSFLLVLVMIFSMSIIGTATMAIPEISWSKCFGGSGIDKAQSIQQTSDGGYIVAGTTSSIDGDVSDNSNNTYASWVVKLNSDGGIEWSKSFDQYFIYNLGGIQQTSDGGYILNGGPRVLKLDSSGEIIWSKNLGDGADSGILSIRQTSDGGYIAGGYYWIVDEPMLGHGSNAYWVVKLDGNGEIVWNNIWGSGMTDEQVQSIQQTNDGGYILVAVESRSSGVRFWINKLDSSGGISWSQFYDEGMYTRPVSIQQTSDEGYIAVGHCILGINGGLDSLVVKLDSSGEIVWSKCFGGSNNDEAFSVQQTVDGGYILAGYSNSIDKDVTGNHGDSDYWILKLDSNGNTAWSKCLGGSDEDRAYSIQQTNDGGLIIAGYSNSFDGDVIGNHGNTDYWIVKLGYVIPVAEVSIDKHTTTLIPGESTLLTATVLPIDATNKSISWSSDNDAVATVDSSGLVKGISPGIAAITVTTEDGELTASCIANVLNPIDHIIYDFDKSVADDTLTWYEKPADINEFRALLVESKALIESDNLFDATVKLETAYKYIDGNRRPKDLVKGESASEIAILIKDLINSLTFHVTGISLDQNQVELTVRSKITLIATIEPYNATDKSVVWTSSNKQVAKVNDGGLVTAMKSGTTIITVTTNDGSFHATCTIKVKE